MLDYLVHYIPQFIYYPVIMTIFANVRGERLNLREIITISLAFFVIDIVYPTAIVRILILFLISYLSRKDLPLPLHMFNGS